MDSSREGNESTTGRGEPAPSVESLSAALADLGVYASVLDAAELTRQAAAAGGNEVLAAVLANALYGAATAAGMLAEGHMLAAGAGHEEMSLARAQVLQAGGGGHPNAAVGMLHWQAGQIAQPLRALARTHDLGPILGAAAHTAQALLALLTLCAVADPDDARGLEPLALLTDAQTALEDAGEDLDRIHDWVTELAASLHH
ncbi:MAG: DUF6245 family protein [Pseudonocardiaceae bacterium]